MSDPLKNRLFILDTNVLLHDPSSPLKFQEHDVYIPFVTLEELDNKKVGPLDVHRNARQATRLLDEIVSQADGDMVQGYPLHTINGGAATGKLFVQRESLSFLSKEHVHKNDNMYLAVLAHLVSQGSHQEVTLVTKDLNLRIKARAMGYFTSDFLHDHAFEDADLVYKGYRVLEKEQADLHYERTVSHFSKGASSHTVPFSNERVNEFLEFPEDKLFRVTDISNELVTLRQVPNYSKEKNAVLGIRALNGEQRAALDLLLDQDIDLVALLGPAGSGKTLLALAAALKQAEEGVFDSILYTRVTTPLGEDIGALPGNEKEKLTPWLGAMEDNLEVLIERAPSVVEGQKLRDLASNVIEIRALTFMRGRTFHRKLVILDEAQNLTPKQMKALTTRAGEGSKLVVLGNLSQIDSPYLSETSSGLAYLVERFKGWPHFGGLVLDKGERSRLANEANVRL